MDGLLWELSTEIDVGISSTSTVCYRVSQVVPARHMVGDYEVAYDLPLPTDGEWADDGGMSAFLATCVEED